MWSAVILSCHHQGTLKRRPCCTQVELRDFFNATGGGLSCEMPKGSHGWKETTDIALVLDDFSCKLWVY